MDKSGLYTRMSDCPEIQRQKDKFEDGDVLASYRQDWKQVDKDTQKATRKFDGMIIYSDGLTHVNNRDLVIWLPYQHQIQKEFVNIRGIGSKGYTLVKCFYEWLISVSTDVKFDLTSMEQLWLAFYMHKKHDKVWDGEKWIKK